MKIKQVIEETGLTDRAIRLYIENDLVKPDCDENYNGRKSIEFSEKDVEQLKNIAILRKANFSIQEIKLLQIGGETARQTIKEYINKTNEKIHFNTEIIGKIGSLTNEENITIEIICERLSTNLVNEKVPAEDMELSPKDQKEKTLFTVMSIIGMFFSIVPAIIILIAVLDCYKYPSFIGTNISEIHTLKDFLLFLLNLIFQYCYLIQFVLSFILFYIYKKNKMIEKKKKRKKKLVITLVVIISISALLTPITYLFHIFSYESRTENPNNYLRTDWGISEQVGEIFPNTLPYSADWNSTLFGKTYPKTTKYFYRYSDEFLGGYTEDMVAEWKLSEDEYHEEKTRILEKESVIKTEKRGQWNCVYFIYIVEDDNDKWETHSFCDYKVLFFAYNDESLTVRYVFSSNYKFFDAPYHETMEW